MERRGTNNAVVFAKKSKEKATKSTLASSENQNFSRENPR